MRRSSLLLALLVGLLAVLAPLPARGQACPPLATRMRAKTAWRGAQAWVAVENQGPDFVENAVLRLGLPASSDLPSPKISASPHTSNGRKIQILRAGDALFFLALAFKPGQTRKFSVKGKLANCDPTTLNFTALTYLVDPVDESVSCPSPTDSVAVNAPGSFYRKHECKAPTPSPTSAGTDNSGVGSFSAVGIGQRCLEATREAPFTRRRSRSRSRKLQTSIESPVDCWAYCSNFGGVPPPFYFNWNNLESQCFCGDSACTLVLDPALTAYLVEQAAPALEPTTSPTTRPTFEGETYEPTAQPSAQPSSSPSTTPSASPSAGPTASPSASPSATSSAAPSSTPTTSPTAPSAIPTSSPTGIVPTASPSAAPTAPTSSPSATPTASPSAAPSSSPSAAPTATPSAAPSAAPSASPTSLPTSVPSARPSAAPTGFPTPFPSPAPTPNPPTSGPSASPSAAPSAAPTGSPTDPTSSPTETPSAAPTGAPIIPPP